MMYVILEQSLRRCKCNWAYLKTLLHVAGVVGAVVVGREALHHAGARAEAGGGGDGAEAGGGHGLLHHPHTPRPGEHHRAVAGEPSVQVVPGTLQQTGLYNYKL